MEITASKLLGYVFGVGAVLAGGVIGLLGLLVLFGNVIGGLTVLSAAGLLFVAGVIALPITRSLLSDRAGIDLSGGAAAVISIGAIAIAIGILVAAGAAAVLSSAGSGGAGESVTTTGPEVTPVEMSAANTNGSAGSYESSPSRLNVRYNDQTQTTVDPQSDDFSQYDAEDGQKFVTIQFQIENTGEQEVDVGPRSFTLVIEGAEHSHQALAGSGSQLSSVTLRPDGSVSGWVVFQIPENTETATLELQDDRYFQTVPATRFTHDSSIDIQVSRG